MGVAKQMADVLRAEQVKVTFFAANERTQEGDGSLGDFWAPWWKARAAEGHAFASHTWDHVYWRKDGKPTAIAPLEPETPDQIRRYADAKIRRELRREFELRRQALTLKPA